MICQLIKVLNMNLKTIIFISTMFLANTCFAQYYSGKQENWLKKADLCKPQIKTSIHHPISEVEIVKDANAFQGYKAVETGNINSLYTESFKKKKEVIIDFGEHLVGKVSFKLKDIGLMQDAILRFKVTFGEVPSDLTLPIEPYTGSLSRGWLQDFIIDVSYDGTYTFTRRIAARYMKIEAIGTSIYSDFCFNNITFEATTSADGPKTELAESTPQIFKNIAHTSENTLKDCMQGVFEDGPKRDRRLWLGDLRLQALVNDVTFGHHDLVRRCLYLFAAHTREDGMVSANVFVQPEVRADDTFLFDYSLFFVDVLYNYLQSTGDTETVGELWPTARRQIELALTRCDSQGLVRDSDDWWVFIDWQAELNKQASAQGVLIYCLQRALWLAQRFEPQRVPDYTATLWQLKEAALHHLWDNDRQVFISGAVRQVSWASQIWLVLAEVGTAGQRQALMRRLQQQPPAIAMNTPYLRHHHIVALLQSGLREEAVAEIKAYWGAMVAYGADTFWEIFDPQHPDFSPYGSKLINSYCHAWSCTPAWFIRQYGL